MTSHSPQPIAGERRALPANSVVELIQRVCQSEPNRLALAFQDKQISFGELWLRAAGIADALAEAGVGAGDRVLLWADRSADVVAAALAVMSLRAAYVPVDPGNPAQRVQAICASATPTVLVYDGATAGGQPPQMGVADLDVAAVTRSGVRTTRALPLADDVAYVIFTSGSTGAPKGVQIEHRSLVNYSAWCAGTLGGVGFGTPLFGNLSFDLAITSLWPTLIHGRQVVIVPGLWDPDSLFGKRPEQFTLIKATPSHVRLFERMVAPNYRDLTTSLVFGGESLDPALIARAGERMSGVRLINHYGPTETTVGCCYHEFNHHSVPNLPSVPIGRPIWNTRAYVLDADLSPVPAGKPGELVIAGLGVARGYLADDANGRFVTDTALGGRAYRTGDMVELLSDNNLLYLGRTDDQIKVGGYRIELGELRQCALAIPEIAEVAFEIIRRDVETVEAFVVPHHFTDADEIAKTVRRILAARLPAAVVPRRVHVVPKLAVNANGKYDPAATRGLMMGGPE